MTSSLLDGVRSAGLIAPGGGYVVLYSGGRDSTCLLDVAVQIAGADAVAALHVNYGLRDAASQDEEHCVAFGAQLGVRVHVRRVTRGEDANGGNVQAWARTERYRAAAELADQSDALIAAGHTASDQVETILYRLASSPSRRALLGMLPREGRLVRPLLAFSRRETTEYCVQGGLSWREDESNMLRTYARGRVRETLVPALREIHPAAERNVLALAALLRDEADVLDALVEEALGGREEISLDRLRALPVALRRIVVQRLADGAAGTPAPGAARRAQEICALPDSGSAALDFPHGVRAVAERGTVRFVRTPPLSARRP